MAPEPTVTVDQSDPNRGRYDPARVGKPNPADAEPYPEGSLTRHDPPHGC